MQRRYLRADLAALRRRRAGLAAAVLFALLLAALDIALGFMTVPHEYGHVWAAALLGLALERLVVRRLYGRLLDTLLATWGIAIPG